MQAIRKAFPNTDIQLLPRLIQSQRSLEKQPQATLKLINFRSFLETLVNLTHLLFHAHKQKKIVFIDKKLTQKLHYMQAAFKIKDTYSKEENFFNFGIKKQFGEQLLELVMYFNQIIKKTMHVQNNTDENYENFDLYEYFKQLVSLLDKMNKEKKLFGEPQQIIKQMKFKSVLFRQLTMCYKLENKLLKISWINSNRQLKQLGSKIEISKNLSNKNKKQLTDQVRCFLMTFSKYSNFVVNFVKTEQKSQIQSSMRQNFQSQQMTENRTMNMESKQNPSSSTIQYHFNYDEVNLDQIIDLKKLSSQISYTSSQLIDYTNCENITNEFYDKFFKNYMNLATFLIQFNFPAHVNKIIVDLKIRCEISMTKLDYLEVQKIIGNILNQQHIKKTQRQIELEFDDQTSKIFFKSSYSFYPKERVGFLDQMFENIDQLLIFYSCLDHIILFNCQKSVSYFLKKKEDEQFDMMSQQKELENIACKFATYLEIYHKQVAKVSTMRK